MRGKQATRREPKPDPIYHSPTITRLINKVMLDGKKTMARNMVYDAISKLGKDEKEALENFKKAIDNVMPVKEIRSRRVGGATYQVPLPVQHWRSEALAIRWIVESARSKSGKPFTDFLYEELKAASTGEGAAVRKRDEVHRMAEANRAFAHFAR
ncbi:30S ribosomal protein S7 [candidate division WWE3 bacterium]|nr:30S ribosomal protein S7 [candidate division WWE3 bacterium]